MNTILPQFCPISLQSEPFLPHFHPFPLIFIPFAPIQPRFGAAFALLGLFSPPSGPLCSILSLFRPILGRSCCILGPFPHFCSIHKHMLLDLTKELMHELGITLVGDVIAILKHAKVAYRQVSSPKIASDHTESAKICLK
uniref:DUF5577 domain-containing protein n=1 Tax=Phasianus colchicus TaxID=9054 RepID=A0A669QZQ5_PHACC